MMAMLCAPLLWLLLFFLWQPTARWDWAISHGRLLLMAVILSPILEEIVFRGAVQGWLREQRYGISALGNITVANLLTSILFATMHLLNHAPLWAAAVLLPSLAFGYFRDRYDGTPSALLAPIALHVFYNAGWFFLFASY